VILAGIIVVLAGDARVGALTLVIVWEVCTIRRTMAGHCRPAMPPARSLVA
jgi:hypothetical protein